MSFYYNLKTDTGTACDVLLYTSIIFWWYYFNITIDASIEQRPYLKHQLCTFMHVQFTPCVCGKDAKFATFKNIFMVPYLKSSRIKNSRDLRITWKLFLDNFKSWKTKRVYNTELKKKKKTKNKTKQNKPKKKKHTHTKQNKKTHENALKMKIELETKMITLDGWNLKNLQ